MVQVPHQEGDLQPAKGAFGLLVEGVLEGLSRRLQTWKASAHTQEDLLEVLTALDLADAEMQALLSHPLARRGFRLVEEAFTEATRNHIAAHASNSNSNKDSAQSETEFEGQIPGAA